MERIPVSSSHVRAIGYDVESQTLEVEYNDGSVYQYFAVPESEHDALMAADSKGKHLNANIKKRYNYAKL